MESLVLQMGKYSFHVSITTGQAILRLVSAKNTLQIGNYHCPADLLFDWFGFDQTSKTVVNATVAKQLNPIKINRRSSVILPLKLVFSG